MAKCLRAYLFRYAPGTFFVDLHHAISGQVSQSERGFRRLEADRPGLTGYPKTRTRRLQAKINYSISVAGTLVVKHNPVAKHTPEGKRLERKQQEQQHRNRRRHNHHHVNAWPG